MHVTQRERWLRTGHAMLRTREGAWVSHALLPNEEYWGTYDPWRISLEFPLGRFPQLYQESETRRARERHPFLYGRPEVEPSYHYRSRYALPLKRAVWVVQGRQKPRVVV